MASNVSKAADIPVRTFLAVDLDDATRDRLAALLHGLEPHRTALKLVKPEALHITVKFLGPVLAARLASIESAARNAAKASTPFSLGLSGLGTFPGGRQSPRVVWVGLARDAGYDAFGELYERTEVALEPLDFARERRPFSPHLTLARARDGVTREQGMQVAEAVERLSQTSALGPPFQVQTLTLFRSDLSPAGPRYTPLAQLPIGD